MAILSCCTIPRQINEAPCDEGSGLTALSFWKCSTCRTVAHILNHISAHMGPCQSSPDLWLFEYFVTCTQRELLLWIHTTEWWLRDSSDVLVFHDSKCRLESFGGKAEISINQRQEKRCHYTSFLHYGKTHEEASL